MNHKSIYLTDNQQQCTPLSASIVHDVVKDLRRAHQSVYFTDLTISATIGWCTLYATWYRCTCTSATSKTDNILVGIDPLEAVFRCTLFLISILGLFRALAFTHELFHQQQLRTFRAFWHVVTGVPLLLPFLMYLPIHSTHHSPKTYGTEHDGEYEDFHMVSLLKITRLFVFNNIVPLLLSLRFGLLTPLSFIFSVVREKIIPDFIHLAVRLPFHVPDARNSMRRENLVIEFFCMLFVWLLAAAYMNGYGTANMLWYATVASVAHLNTVRSICATHLYLERPVGRESHGQMLDSINVESGVLAFLFCPVGLGYHALHHIAPYLPYHSLPIAHARLMALLPPNSDYRFVTVPNMFEGFKKLMKATSTPTTA